jgi:hypothetical protein
MIPFINAEPVAVAGALRAVLWALVLLGLIALDEKQLAAIAIAAELVLTRSRVSPTGSV